MKLKNIIFPILICGLMFVANSNAQTKDTPEHSINQTKNNSSDKSVKIIKKMFSGLYSRNCSTSSGIVSVRATFDKSAKITDAEIVKSSGCVEFDENALTVAKKIKFEPAVKDGEPITTTKVIQYTFSRR